jgi:acyl-CoA synthetase (AMP-forming)/AMP-acid ligase II
MLNAIDPCADDLNLPLLHDPTKQLQNRRLGSVGQAVKGAELAIVGTDGNVCGEGQEGEIWASGPMVFEVN